MTIDEFMTALKADLLKISDTFTIAHLEAAAARVLAPVEEDADGFVDSLTKGAVDPTKTVLDDASDDDTN